ncbi:hypothetical protein Vadar_020651 [Vaccinium darrowii]|uniref:Uncharacterized protein n=1 Tax=Vaccinium darrowii TaxID=229202 RepID=A0ACB7ZKG2_9ERIC|nr:hypothetical protein Vadar_020651 [Vaccinium darrowii]
MDYYDDYLNGPYLYPLPWVGLYIAVASLICSVAMAGDVVHGFRWKVLWFPCKFFTVNAASLTLLAVATKLTVDLTTAMLGRTDRMSKLSSTIFVTIVMGNFLTSFASMDSNAILINIAALGILVITIFVDGIIQIPTSGIDTSVIAEEGFVLLSMLFLFVTLSFSALTVPTTKKHLELKYGELHKIVSNGGTLEETAKLTNQKLKEVVKIYWVMAVTSSPQFVMARSVTSATSGIICLLTVGTLIESMVRIDLVPSDSAPLSSSAYMWSAAMILWIQFIGVLVGSVAPIFRWFTAINLNRRNVLSNWHLNTLILVENYWIQRFVEWKERPLALGNRGMKCKKLIQNVKNLVMNLCIGVQFGIVVVSKVAQFISIIILILPFSACYNYYKRLNENRRSKTKVANENPTSESGRSPTNHTRSERETLDAELDLSDYVLQLEGEVKLPTRILKNICDEVNQVIQMATHRKPKNLTELLRKSSNNFKGVVDFDSSQVPHCWALPVVTLTSIATALPNIACHRVEQLKSSVSEGLSYIDIVEKSLSSKGDDLLDIKHAVDVTWGRIELYGKWLNEDLKLALTRNSSNSS